jgi:hypothetical protein
VTYQRITWPIRSTPFAEVYARQDRHQQKCDGELWRTQWNGSGTSAISASLNEDGSVCQDAEAHFGHWIIDCDIILSGGRMSDRMQQNAQISETVRYPCVRT